MYVICMGERVLLGHETGLTAVVELIAGLTAGDAIESFFSYNVRKLTYDLRRRNHWRRAIKYSCSGETGAGKVAMREII